MSEKKQNSTSIRAAAKPRIKTCKIQRHRAFVRVVCLNREKPEREGKPDTAGHSKNQSHIRGMWL